MFLRKGTTRAMFCLPSAQHTNTKSTEDFPREVPEYRYRWVILRRSYGQRGIDNANVP